MTPEEIAKKICGRSWYIGESFELELIDMLKQLILCEREACAKVADLKERQLEIMRSITASGGAKAAGEIAQAIRARGVRDE